MSYYVFRRNKDIWVSRAPKRDLAYEEEYKGDVSDQQTCAKTPQRVLKCILTRTSTWSNVTILQE